MSASAPIDASNPMVFRPDVTAEPSAIDLDDSAQAGRRNVRCQRASQLGQQDECGLRMQTQAAAQLKAANALGSTENKLNVISSVRIGSFRHASKVPLVGENCRWHALLLGVNAP
jgi:hypothetical protein